MIQESWVECLRLLGIKNFKPTRPQCLFLRASCPGLLKRHPNQSWWFRNKMRLRNELLMILGELGPVPDEELDLPEQNHETIPLFESSKSQSKECGRD